MSPSTLIVLTVATLVALLYWPLAMWATKDMLERFPPWNVRGVALELIGKLARIISCWPALPVHADCFEVFDLQRNFATSSEVGAAAALWVACMQENPWSYPASQQQVLRQHVTTALAYALSRELAERAEAERAEAGKPVVRSWLREVDPDER